MALLSTLAKPALATCSLTGEFFESLRKQFMELESPLDISSKQVSSIEASTVQHNFLCFSDA
ncbi:hypothetical protein AAVH_43724, partial [Aphelenchoides avenae]